MISSYEAKPEEVKKVLLLYSGGLDTSVMVKWIQEKYNAEVFTLTLDVGQPLIELDHVKNKALKLGAKDAFVVDVKKEFAEEYVLKAIKANALYQGKYPLSTALARPLQAKVAVEYAEKINADTIAHGSTGKGNDQVRFDASIITLNPEMKIIAPVREWNMSRDKELEYAKKHGIEISENNKKYSTDENLWGKSSECDVLEFPDKEPPEDVFSFCIYPKYAPNQAEYISIEFEKGKPIALNKKKMDLHELIQELNEIAGKHGVGIYDHMEDRTIGLKSREVYECPAAACILEAHKDLEKFVSTGNENHFKAIIENEWSKMVYTGLWFDPLMNALNSFIEEVNEKVSGTVNLKLFKGNAAIVGRKSPNALYDHNLATYNEGQTFNQKASPGFIELWSLQSKMAYQLKKGKK
ncbi:MAG: argininosuccinate synthase [Candidatus Diapherotrites archaeon]